MLSTPCVCVTALFVQGNAPVNCNLTVRLFIRNYVNSTRTGTMSFPPLYI